MALGPTSCTSRHSRLKFLLSCILDVRTTSFVCVVILKSYPNLALCNNEIPQLAFPFVCGLNNY